MDKKRLFLALKVSKEVSQELQRLQKELEFLNKKAHLRWTAPENFHLTLAFLGEWPDQAIEAVTKVGQEIATSHQSLDLWLDKINGFPSKSKPNIVNVAVANEHRKLELLRQDLATALHGHGFDTGNKEWHPHITIARNNSGEHLDGMHSIEPEKVVWQVNKFSLFSSHRTGSKPIYKELSTFDLN